MTLLWIEMMNCFKPPPPAPPPPTPTRFSCNFSRSAFLTILGPGTWTIQWNPALRTPVDNVVCPNGKLIYFL